MSLIKDVDIFVSTIDQPCFQTCIDSIKNQTYKGFSLKVIRNVEPMNEAFNQMVMQADKAYFVQVDEDFILDPTCIDQLRAMLGKEPLSVVFLCADLYDVGRKRNVQGIKIYRTELMKKYVFKNVTDCEMDLIRQIEHNGKKWSLSPTVLGKHAPDYSPKAAFFRFKSMAEKQRFSFNVFSSDLYEMMESFTKPADRIKLFSILGMITGMVSPRNSLGRERVKDYYHDSVYDNLDAYFNHYANKVRWPKAMGINEPPEVSVIMPLYNTEERYVSEAIESILTQSYRDFEFIIVLNGAPPSLISLVSKYKAKDKRILLASLHSPDIRKALNEGISLARGKYIVRQDADDISSPLRLEVQYRYMLDNPSIGFCGSDVYIINDHSVVQNHYTGNPHTYEEICNTLKHHNCFTHGSVMAKAQLMKQHKYSYEDYTLHCEDYELWLRLVFASGVKCANINLPLYSYRENMQGVQRSNLKVMQDNAKTTSLKYSGFIKSMLDCKEEGLGFGFKNKVLNYKELEGNKHVPVLDDICASLSRMGVPYNIDGLDDVNGKLSRYWEYTQAAAVGYGAKVVLDAGSGFSIFPLLLAKMGAKVYSTDSSYQDIREYQASRLGLDITNNSYSFQVLRYPDNFFDVVYCISCIEHLNSYRDLELSLSQFQRVLKPGGILVISFDYHKDYFDYGTASWKWSESTRYFNWESFISIVASRLLSMQLIDPDPVIDTTDWSRPPINKNYTFALTAFRKVE